MGPLLFFDRRPPKLQQISCSEWGAAKYVFWKAAKHCTAAPFHRCPQKLNIKALPLAEPMIANCPVGDASMELVHDFSWLLVVAAMAAMVARLLHFPLLLSYILGGIAVDFSIRGEVFIHAQSTIHQIGELGVIFLMFYMGLEFDLKKLRQLFGPVIIALVFQTFFMIFLGRAVAPILGWGGLNGLFLGGLLAISSTMIAVPVLADQKALQKNFARLAMGLLVFEDILAVLLLVVLSGIAITGYFDWDAVGRTTFFVGAFVLTIFFVGRLIMPFFVRIMKKFRSEEFFTIVIIGVLLTVGLLAETAHFSTALGAFLAGAIFSNTEIAESIEECMRPIRTLFTAIFFLSTGLMADPAKLLVYAWPIVLITFLVFVLKVVACFLGFFLSGQSGEDSFRAPMATAQIGEFSFVIATLGSSLGVTTDGLISIAIGVSLGTAFFTAILSPRAGEIFRFLLRICPKSLLKFGRIYREMLAALRLRFSHNSSFKFAMKPLIYVVVNALLFFSVLIVASYLVRSALHIEFIGERYANLATICIWCCAALISLPILTALVRQVNVLFVGTVEKTFASMREKPKNFLVTRIGGVFQTAVYAFLLLFLGGIFLSVAAPTLPRGVPLYAFLVLILFAGLIFRRRMVQINTRLEGYFVETFNRDIESQLTRQRDGILKKLYSQSGDDLDLMEVSLVEDNCGCYSRICDVSLRERFSVNIIALRHRSHLLFSPPADCLLVPGMTLILIGNRADLERAQLFFSTQAVESGSGGDMEAFEIGCLCLHGRHEFVGKTLAESNLRKKYMVSVVKILRKSGAISTPPPTEVLCANDVLVLAGEETAIRRTVEQLDCAAADGHC
ncbi:MAG: cation:proton antiporter [Puniceicoccales bacterium]|nr:cation:proton antiporter [Puniceicoccales bacterium]